MWVGDVSAIMVVYAQSFVLLNLSVNEFVHIIINKAGWN